MFVDRVAGIIPFDGKLVRSHHRKRRKRHDCCRGTGYVDVTISSTDGSDAMSDFSLDLQISGLPGVSFVNPQSNPYSLSGYVFSGNSANENNSADFFSVLASPYQDINGGDSTADLGNTSLLTTPMLLARLAVQVAPAATPGVRPITLLDSSLFQADFANGLPFATPLPVSGDITVTAGGPAIPEPSSLALMAGLGLAAVLSRRASRRTSKTAAC